MKCERIGDYVIVTGISQDVPAYTEVGVRVTVINPSRSGTTGFFTIDTGRNSTNTIYDRKAAIQGVYIDPGRISNIVFEPKYENTLLTRKKIVIYRLSFLLTNALEKGGSIKLFFNSNFNMDSSTYSLVEYGLDDISFTDTVTFSYNSSTKIMTISNFNTFSPKEISILMQIENPSEEG